MQQCFLLIKLFILATSPPPSLPIVFLPMPDCPWPLLEHAGKSLPAKVGAGEASTVETFSVSKRSARVKRRR